MPPLGAFRTFQVPIGDIAVAAGVDFGPLPDVDVIGVRTARPRAWRLLSGPEDIVL